MSDWRRGLKRPEEEDEADLLELMELEDELGYKNGYLEQKRAAKLEELRKKRKKSQLIREIIFIALFVIATVVVIILVRKCTGDDKKPVPTESGQSATQETPEKGTSGKESGTEQTTEQKTERTKESTTERTTEPTTQPTTEPPTEATKEPIPYTVPTRRPDTETTTAAPQTDAPTEGSTEAPTQAPTDPPVTEAPGMVYNGVQLPPYRPLQQGAAVAVQSGITMPSWIVQDLIPVDGAHRPGLAINPIKHVVIHYVGNTLSSAKDNRDYFATPPDSAVYDGRQVSSHFIIGLYGEIIQCVPLNEVAYAQGVAADSGRPNHNWDAISIENSHYNDAGEFTSMTEESLVKLTAWLLQSYGLPANTDTILRHYDCSGKACPKDWADNPAKYEAFVQKVAQYMAAHPNISAEFP